MTVAREESPHEPFQLGYHPALDGIRGVAISLVLLVHLGILPAQCGFIGVDLFFVLSGFLITALLIAEFEQFHAISLTRFYWRRALRLLPALLVMLSAGMLYLSLTSSWKIVGRNLVYALRALFYGTNWAMIFNLGERANHLFNHTWSLSIEEQFYFLWPAILLLMLRRIKAGTSRLWFVLLGALVSGLVRIVLVALDENNFWRFYCGLDTRADSLLLGCCAGIIISHRLLPRRGGVEIGLKLAALFSVPGLYFLSGKQLHDPWMYCVGWFLTSVFAAVIVLQLVFTSRSPLHAILQSRPLVYIGRISYGLYLWHQPVFYAIKSYSLSLGEWRALSLAITLAVTLVSYYLIERPCLRWKQRFQMAS